MSTYSNFEVFFMSEDLNNLTAEQISKRLADSYEAVSLFSEINYDSYNDVYGAVTLCDKLIELYPTNVEVYSLKAYASYKLSRYDVAITCSEKVLELDSDNEEAKKKLSELK